jgi:ElaA protein
MASSDVTSLAFAELDVARMYEILRLRSEVFVVEQECAYLDIDGRDREPGTLHHWIDREGSVAAYARTLTDPDGATRIGRVVTSPTCRGEGLAARLVSEIVAGATGALVLDAQSYLIEWYRRLGFDVAGDEFVEDGIPHVPMTRPPASEA